MSTAGALRSWAHALGGEVVGRQVVCPGPGHSRGDRSLTLKLSANAPNGYICFSHAGDDIRVCRDHIDASIGLPLFEPGRHRNPAKLRGFGRDVQIPATSRSQDNATIAAKLWQLSRPLAGTVGETYLREVRGIRCDLPPTMRFLAPKGEHPATIVTAFGLPSEPEPGTMDVSAMKMRAVHRTRLTPEGQKIGKAMLGSPAGLPLVLAPWTDSLGLVIAEGIEDALTAHQATGLAAWAAGSAPHLPKIAESVPSWTDCTTILVDSNDAGRVGSGALANLLTLRGIAVELCDASTITGKT